MAHLSDKANQLRDEYYNKYGMPPRGWSHGEETMNEYEDFLKSEINKSTIKVLFVCLGNICRSPMAEFIFKDMIYKKGLASSFIIKSAAISYEEIGNDMHYEAKDKLKQKNIPFSKREATRITSEDYKYYDFIIAMEYEKAENIKDFFNRVYEFLDKIKSEYVDKRILIVAHGGISIPVNCYFNGIPQDDNLLKLILGNCEVVKYQYK